MEEKPALFQKYEMGRLLGKGTFAKVYYGNNLVSGESVAIKVIEKKNVMKDEMMNQIKREISVMRLVRHPNVVELKEVLATKTKIFFIMEYVKGGELFEKVARGKLGEDDARRYFQQLISAVDFCHSRGVSHRDLKPENLLLDDEGNLKVSDFGLSSLPEQLRKDGLLHTRCGTPAYVAPEVLLRDGYDGAKADIWSCGVILFVLHAGFLPFRDQNAMLMYRKIYKAEYKFPPWFSSEIKKLVSKMLIPDPERRVSIPLIMKLPWFTKGFRRPSLFTIDNLPGDCGADDGKGESRDFYSAFDIISPAFDLSNLFEKKRRAGLMFSSRWSAPAIMENIEGIARGLEFKVAKLKGSKMMMQAAREGRKGKLMVTAEVHEAAPDVAFVELCKSSGDTLEYAKFCEENLRPALKDIVWSWPGENSCNCCQDVSVRP